MAITTVRAPTSMPLLMVFRREGREDELRLVWNGEEAIEIARSMLGHRAELLAGDALLVLRDKNASEALERLKADLTVREPRG